MEYYVVRIILLCHTEFVPYETKIDHNIVLISTLSDDDKWVCIFMDDNNYYMNPLIIIK